MHRSDALPLLASAALVTFPLTAQTQLSLPLHADLVDGHHSLALPFGTPGFRTQILVDAAAIAPNGAVLSSIAFRADRPSVPLSPQQLPNITVELSQTTTFINGMSPTFASNVTSTPTIVFQGAVNLPASSPSVAGPQPWNIVITFPTPFVFTTSLGNLLIDITGNNPTGGQANYWLDAVQGGGSGSYFGTGGDNPNDYLSIGAYAGNGETRALTPGQTIFFSSFLMVTSPPGVVAIGTAPQPVPIDLTPLGAPTNFLYVDPIVLAAHTWTLGWIGWYSEFGVTVPNVPSFIGATLYAQSSIFEPAANPLGLVLTNALEIRIGDATEQLPLQQLDAPDPTAATGTLVDFSYTTTPDYGSTPVRFGGTFF